MITYRIANLKDAESIGLLHAQSWQRHYRGIWSDTFLDGSVTENRLEVWQKRLQTPAENQQVVVAEMEGRMVGFVCVFAEEDATFGALLDNLHVSSELKGSGIGKELMRRAATWVYGRNEHSPIYLWVLVKNEAARQFYDRLGGVNQEMVAVANPDGSFSDCYRYVWKDVKQLMK